MGVVPVVLQSGDERPQVPERRGRQRRELRGGPPGAGPYPGEPGGAGRPLQGGRTQPVIGDVRVVLVEAAGEAVEAAVVPQELALRQHPAAYGGQVVLPGEVVPPDAPAQQPLAVLGNHECHEVAEVWVARRQILVGRQEAPGSAPGVVQHPQDVEAAPEVLGQDPDLARLQPHHPDVGGGLHFDPAPGGLPDAQHPVECAVGEQQPVRRSEAGLGEEPGAVLIQAELHGP